MARIGILGGSFNPAHHGHRHISLHAIRLLGLDEVWWLVSPGNPLKKDAPDMAPFEARLASAAHMARGARIRVSDVEQRLNTRFTVDTVRGLRAAYPRHDFIWLMGADGLSAFHKWRDWRGLARIVPIAVIPRPGYDRSARAARAMGWLRGFVRPPGQATRWTEWSAPAITFLRLPKDPASATAVRALDPRWHRRMPGSPNRAAFPMPLTPRRALDRPSA